MQREQEQRSQHGVLMPCCHGGLTGKEPLQELSSSSCIRPYSAGDEPACQAGHEPACQAKRGGDSGEGSLYEMLIDQGYGLFEGGISHAEMKAWQGGGVIEG